MSSSSESRRQVVDHACAATAAPITMIAAATMMSRSSAPSSSFRRRLRCIAVSSETFGLPCIMHPTQLHGCVVHPPPISHSGGAMSVCFAKVPTLEYVPSVQHVETHAVFAQLEIKKEKSRNSTDVGHVPSTA